MGARALDTEYLTCLILPLQGTVSIVISLTFLLVFILVEIEIFRIMFALKPVFFFFFGALSVPASPGFRILPTNRFKNSHHFWS